MKGDLEMAKNYIKNFLLFIKNILFYFVAFKS